MDKRQIIYNLLLLLVTIVWGSTFFVIKSTIDSIDEFLIVGIRNLIATLSLLIVIFITNRRLLFDVQILKKGCLLGTFLFLIYIAQVIGLKYTTTGHSAFITGIAVILVPVFLFLFFKERYSIPEISSLLIVVTGLYFLTINGSHNLNVGDLITLVSAFSAAIHIILASRYVLRYNTLGLVFYQFLSTSIISFLCTILFSEKDNNFSNNSIILLIYLGLIGTLFCYFTTMWIQKYLPVVTVVLIFSLEPIIASLFGYYLLGEKLSIKEIIGAFLILSGVISYQLVKIRSRKIND